MSSNFLPIKLSDFNKPIKSRSELLVIAGPCVIENEDLIYKIAAEMKEICAELKMPYVFKASFDKANRTSYDSFRGPGLKEGLKLLKQLKDDLGLWVLSDIHSIEQVEPAAEVLDIIQIPAFLCRQTDLLVEAAKTGKVVNVKKGQFLAPNDVVHIGNKIKATGNPNILITERGTTFGYNNLVVDMRSIHIIQEELKLPVIFDCTHSVQLPGGAGNVSGGKSVYAPILASSAVAAGAFGLFMEVHPNPAEALSDGPNMIRLDKVPALLKRLKAIKEACSLNPL
ncbi:MAG: 3-deoxy-8-phosphooctulonate synthase [Candidatus Caenarcaniphilales bacterium]|nr:3-deoxy-8-phosphooctulonate synthase [Candidatus Caenarcaniphilales bacterium]